MAAFLRDLLKSETVASGSCSERGSYVAMPVPRQSSTLLRSSEQRRVVVLLRLMLFTPNPPVTDLESALANLRQLAVESFTDALEQAHEPKPDDDPQDDEKTRARKLAPWKARISEAKAQMASALQQLAQADVMLSESKGRSSYRTLVALITSTNTALSNLMNNTGGTTT